MRYEIYLSLSPLQYVDSLNSIIQLHYRGNERRYILFIYECDSK